MLDIKKTKRKESSTLEKAKQTTSATFAVKVTSGQDSMNIFRKSVLCLNLVSTANKLLKLVV